MPKLNHFRKKGSPDILEAVESPKARQKILEAIQTIELHMVLSCVAMGALQMLALYIADKPDNDNVNRSVISGRHLQILFQKQPSCGIYGNIFPSYSQESWIDNNTIN